MNEETAHFDPLLERFAHIKEKFGDNYPIVLYEPSIHCQEKKILKDLIQGKDSINLFSKFNEASQFVQSLDISFILIISRSFDEQHVLKNFQEKGKNIGRTMFDFEEEALFQDLFQSLPRDFIKSLKIKAFVFVTLLDFMIKAPVNKGEDEEIMIMSELKEMAKEFRQDFLVFWYDPQINSERKRELEERIELRIEERNIFLDSTELYQKIDKYSGIPYHLIFSGRDKAEKIIKDSESFTGLLGLYIYDDNSPESFNEKVEIKKSLQDLIPKIKEGFRTRSKLINTFPSFATNFDERDKTEIFNMHYYLKGLTHFDNRKQAKRDFLNLARRIYQDQDRLLTRFESEYEAYNPERILHWYTKDSPVYRVVNNCLRIASSDSILYSRFILRELERAIREHYQKHWKDFNGVVHRGAYISAEEWTKLEKNIGEEIEMYGFLSTSVNKRTAINFFRSDARKKIFITIIVPPLPEFDEQGFADVSQFSEFGAEGEILFNVRSKFRILEAKISKIDDRTRGRHLVLLYGARPLRSYMTKHKPEIKLDLNLASEKKCGECESTKQLFAFNQGVTEIRCFDCLGNKSIPKDIPLLAFDLKSQTESIKTLKGKMLKFQQEADFSSSGYKCFSCQQCGKEKYYKWLEFNTEKYFVQCADCFKNSEKFPGKILLAESSPYAFWQEYQQEWEAADERYQLEVSISMVIKEKYQGDVYLDVQRYDLCLEYERKLINKLKRVRWRELAKLQSFQRNGEANKKSSRFQKAAEFYKKTLNIAEFGYKEKNFHALYNAVADVYQSLGQNRNALEYLTKAIDIVKSRFGENHPETAIPYNDIGLVYENLGKYEKALGYFTKALDIRKTHFGEKHPETATSYSNYALACEGLERHQEALAYFSKSLDIRKAIFGENHPDTAASYYNIAAVFHRLKRYQEQREYSEKALWIRKRILGDQNADTALAYNSYATACDSLGQDEEALECHKKALKIRRAIFGDRNPETANSYSNYAAVLHRLEQHQEALNYFKMALDIFQDTYEDENHLNILTLYNNCGMCCQSLKQYHEALDYFNKGLRVSIKVFGDKHQTSKDLYSKHLSVCQEMRQS